MPRLFRRRLGGAGLPPGSHPQAAGGELGDPAGPDADSSAGRSTFRSPCTPAGARPVRQPTPAGPATGGAAPLSAVTGRPNPSRNPPVNERRTQQAATPASPPSAIAEVGCPGTCAGCRRSLSPATRTILVRSWILPRPARAWRSGESDRRPGRARSTPTDLAGSLARRASGNGHARIRDATVAE